ncbi:MAG: type III pantothenate kinase [Candidatus Marinimicrobia bacterium]|nr:type III pantothenate kinase [Candidatus Neomarinimicrobiota bacterium]
MILALDIGNTTIHGGVFKDEELIFQFRKTSKNHGSSDEIGVFLHSVLTMNKINPDEIKEIALCSVVPDAVYSIRNACIKYFNRSPFELQAGVKTGLKIRYRNPLEVGADRIANSIAAIHRYPNNNLIIVDFGTATTFCVINKDKEYLGGIIVPGINISLESLVQRTAKLQSVEIVERKKVMGRTTATSIQSGLYFGQIGIVREVTQRVTNEEFSGNQPVIIGTGGFSGLFSNCGIFNTIIPDLALQGLRLALLLNR